MYWCKKLYCKEVQRRKIRQIKKKISADKAVPGIYVIVLSEKEGDWLELIPSIVLCQPYYPKRNLKIIGLANGRLCAMELVVELVEKILSETQSIDVKSYFHDAVFSCNSSAIVRLMCESCLHE